MTLSFLMVTRAEQVVTPYIEQMLWLAWHCDAQVVFGADAGCAEKLRMMAPRAIVIPVKTGGYQETVQDSLLEHCTGTYVFRIDDDEVCSPALAMWLQSAGYVEADRWQFARAWLWTNGEYIKTFPHWPDYQTRLSVKAKAGGHYGLHPLSPFGAGRLGPGVIEHHKLVCRTLEEREAQCRFFDSISPGAGIRAFYTPEAGMEGRTMETRVTAAEWIRRSQKLGLPMQQHGAEIEAFLDWYMQRFPRPTRVLEIGSGFGGTAALWCEIVTGSEAQVISIDMPFGVHGGTSLDDMRVRDAKLREAYPCYHPITADSQLDSTFYQLLIPLGGLVDILFIDGDHRYECAKRDYDLYSKLVRPGGVILLHDIEATPFYAGLQVNVRQLWEELPGERHEWSIHDPMWGGLGAMIKSDSIVEQQVAYEAVAGGAE